MRRTSLNRIFTVALTLFTICVIVAVSWFFNHQENSVLLGAMKRHANSLAENLASKSEYPLWFNFYPDGVVDESLKTLVEETAQDKDVQFAAIFSKSGEIIVEQKLARQPVKFQQHLQQVVQDILRLKASFTYDFEGMYYILIPVRFALSREADVSAEQPSTQAPKPKLLTFPDQSDLLGLAVVGFSLESVASVLQQMQVEMGGLALFIILLVVVLSRFLANTISDPIEQLAGGTQRIARGDLTHEVQVNTTNEIGDLAESFNQMMHDLRSSRKELELWTQTLEQRVEERTREIQEKNARLTELVDKMAHMQEQLVHSEKMSSLGQLVAGIAHEINNPVNFISSNITPLNTYIRHIKKLLKRYEDTCRLSSEEHAHFVALKQEMDFDFLIDDLESLIHDIGSGAARIKRIVQDLRNFSRLDEAELKTIDLHQSLDTTLNLLGHLYENRITVYKQYGAIPAIECYAGQLNQVFMNLLANAAQAFDRKNKGNVWITTWCEPPYVYIAIRDNGCGIPEDILPKIFDPFFTTKDVGEGTGLGLSISHGIIEKHQGEITATSRVGEGTEFTIMIPQKLSKVRRSELK